MSAVPAPTAVSTAVPVTTTTTSSIIRTTRPSTPPRLECRERRVTRSIAILVAAERWFPEPPDAVAGAPEPVRRTGPVGRAGRATLASLP